MVKKIKNNNKGFTLIELLAVIVILGVLMIIAIPMVSKYIRQSKQNAYVDTAKSYIQAARYAFFNDEYSCGDSSVEGTLIIPFKYIDVDRSNGKSPYNKNIDIDNSYVKITTDANGQYTYYVAVTDGANGISEKEEKELSRSDVKNIGKLTIPAAATASGSSPAIVLCTK